MEIIVWGQKEGLEGPIPYESMDQMYDTKEQQGQGNF